MINIYSVLIQNEKTLESFDEFSELFTKAIDRQEIGICKWNEAGTDMETALPELLTLIDEKEDWRAVIVISEESSEMARFASDPKNPFDFNVDGYEVKPLEASEIPLIRLTHILGGVPAPDLEFKCEKVEELNKEARMIYKPVKSPEKEAAYKKLMAQYDYPGKKPSEIIIVSLRQKLADTNRDLKQIWETKKEINSSEFWKRNHYPSACRFIVYDVENEGRTQRYSDMFNFWMSIMLMITNHINANILQAYRLYRIESEFDKEVMQENFQRIVYRLTGAHRFIHETILQEERMKLAEERNIPMYIQEVPVTLDITKKGDFSIDPEQFELVADDRGNDIFKWEALKTDVENNLKKSYRMAERKLDEAASNSKKLCSYPKELVYPLTPYQQEDMRDELDGIYSTILTLQKNLPDQKKTIDKNLVNAAKGIKHSISLRLKRGTMVNILIITAVLLALAVIPGIVYSISEHAGDTFNALVWLIIAAAAFLGTSIYVLLNQKKGFNDTIMQYNSVMMDSVGELYKNADIYSHYISNVVSHCRGRSFLNAVNRDELKKNNENSANQKLLIEIELMLNKLKKWCVANYINVDFSSKYFVETTVDLDIAPQMLISNLMESSNRYLVDLNYTGDVVESPFEFVTRLEIVREELYDDAQYI